MVGPSRDCFQTTFGRLSKNVAFHATFQAADQTTFFERFKSLKNGHATVVGGHATVGRLSNNVFWDVSSDLGKFWKKSLNGHATVVEVTRPSADCQTTFRNKRCLNHLGKFCGKSRWTVTRQWSEESRDRRLTVKQRFWTFQAIRNFFWNWTVTRQWSEVTRLSVDCQASTFFETFQAIWERFWKKVADGHATVVEVTRPSADCQTTFFGRFKQFGKILKKVAERSRDSGRRSRDRRPTVKQRFLDVSSN